MGLIQGVLPGIEIFPGTASLADGQGVAGLEVGQVGQSRKA